MRTRNVHITSCAICYYYNKDVTAAVSFRMDIPAGHFNFFTRVFTTRVHHLRHFLVKKKNKQIKHMQIKCLRWNI